LRKVCSSSIHLVFRERKRQMKITSPNYPYHSGFRPRRTNLRNVCHPLIPLSKSTFFFFFFFFSPLAILEGMQGFDPPHIDLYVHTCGFFLSSSRSLGFIDGVWGMGSRSISEKKKAYGLNSDIGRMSTSQRTNCTKMVFSFSFEKCYY